MPPNQSIIFYDRNCGFCRYLASIVLRWDRDAEQRLTPIALQDPGAAKLLGGMSEADRMASWHLVGPGGEIVSAGAALPVVLDLVGRYRLVANSFRRFPAATERGYRWVTEHRNTLGRAARNWAALRGHTYPPVITEGDGDITRCSIA